MIQKDIFTAAGVPEQDIRQLEAAWEALQTVKSHAPHQTPHIACTGIYNAGKSTLLNALAGKEIFPTGDIPTTKKVAQAEFGGAVYIDTPGLNAAEEDDQETQAAYETADFILFVSSAQNGGISAAEAEWLQKLKARYSSLQQRLVFVLTHCTQVAPEQLPTIREKVSEDLKKSLDFEPSDILCVDSITYQRGKQEGKTALIEHSGILQLQDCLAKQIAGAEKALRDAQEMELANRRNAVLDQIARTSAAVRANIDRTEQVNREKITNVDRIWAEFEKSLEESMPSEKHHFISAGSVDLKHRHGPEIKERSESSARRKLENQLSSNYNNREYAAKKAALLYKSDAKNYCYAGPGSAYAACCSRISGVFDASVLALQKLGVSISPIPMIAVSPDIPSDLMRQVEQELTSDLVDYGEYYTLSKYVEMYADVSCMDEYVRGMFGIERLVEMYSIYDSGYAAVREMEKDLQRNIDSNVGSVNSMMSRYWEGFRKKLTAEVESRKANFKHQVDTYKTSLTRVGTPVHLQDALTRLDVLKREVSQ